MRKSLITFLIISSTIIAASQTRDDAAMNKVNEIAAKIRTFENRSLQLRGRIVYIDSTIHDNNYEYRNIADPFGTLQGCYIFFAGSSNLSEEDSSVIGVYRNEELVWLSEKVSMAESGRLLCTKDINNDGKVEIIAAWSVFAAPNYEFVIVFSWDGSRGLKVSSDESAMDGNSGSFEITDLNGDGFYEITATTLDEEGQSAKVVYSWNGFEFGNWPDSPSYNSQTFSVANNLQVILRADVRKVSGASNFKYLIQNIEKSRQTIKEIFFSHRTTLKTISLDPIEGWSFGVLAQSPLFYFIATEASTEVPPGRSINNLSFTTEQALPIISDFYIQAPHLKPITKNLADLPSASLERAKNVYVNSFRAVSLGPGDPPEPFLPLLFLDTLISYKHQALDLGWIKDKGIANSLDQKLDNAKAQLLKNNKTAAKNILQAFINEVEAQKDKHLTSEAYALLKFNAEYLISRL